MYVALLRARVRVFLEYLAIDALKYSRAPDLARGRGDTPRWGLMAGSAACCTTYIRHFPLVPVQRQSNELPATTVGECRRRHSLRRHKGGRWTVRLISRHQVLQGGFSSVVAKRATGLRWLWWPRVRAGWRFDTTTCERSLRGGRALNVASLSWSERSQLV